MERSYDTTVTSLILTTNVNEIGNNIQIETYTIPKNSSGKTLASLRVIIYYKTLLFVISPLINCLIDRTAINEVINNSLREQLYYFDYQTGYILII